MELRVNILGVPISVVNMEKTLSLLTSCLAEAKQGYVCVSNVHTTVMAYDDMNYRQVQAESFLTLPDGKPLSIIGQRRGYSEMEQVRGVELMQRLFSEPACRSYRHYFYGNTSENLHMLLQSLRTDYPDLCIAGAEPSVFHELSDDECAALANRVREAQTDFLWVGLGAPRQEFLCARLKGSTGAVPIGVGGAFNVLAHIVPDAPIWMRKLSLEWLYRLLKEPKRLLKRYIVTNAKFLWLTIVCHRD